ncbi:MAG: septation protein A [Gemmatimonadetes bacterium]|nr:septation protein A [Gemmatimonadota bacterium]
MNSTVKGLLDFGPLLIFFFANARWGIVAATAAFMIAITIALAVSYWKTRKVSTMQLVTAVVVLVFGGMTVAFRDETFIKLKPTIVNALFGVILLGGVLRGRALLQPILGSVMKMSDEGWRLLSIRWGFFFLTMAAVNEAVWRNVSTDAWVTFKVFGFLPLTLLFTMSQIPLISKHAIEEEGVQI